MALPTILQALRRGSSTVDQRVESSRRGSLYVNYDMPRYAALAKAGKIWTVGEATAVAGVVALPTTTAGISLYNDEPEGSGKDYIILAIFGTQVANAAAQASWHMSHCLNIIKPTTKPTADIASTSFKNAGKTPSSPYGGKAIVDLGATVTDDLWKPIGGSVNTAVVSLSGTSVYVPMDGAVIIEPGGLYSLKAIASAVDITVRLGFVWAEDADWY